MTIVLDTNVIIQLFGTKSPWIRLQKAIVEGRVILAVSTGILLEYEEVITRLGGPSRWRRVWQVLELTGQIHNNVRQVEPSYEWRLITTDPDDNKFVDCAIAARADWIVTEDRHYEAIKSSGHRPQPITPEAFIRDVLPALPSKRDK